VEQDLYTLNAISVPLWHPLSYYFRHCIFLQTSVNNICSHAQIQ